MSEENIEGRHEFEKCSVYHKHDTQTVHIETADG
jgi:hypothetical protein